MPAESLKSKLDGSQLDLSLSSLTVIPVKELAALPKATGLDLSCNLLTTVPNEFCTLIHLVKIDLSKNQLTELPENFGYLQKLQHLDLYQNRLRSLPISFCRLNALKWLDIKENQLEDANLVAAAGECLSDLQCKTCAKQVVAYMKKVQSDQERERQKRLAELRAQEAARKADEEREVQRKRAEKKAEKELRRLRSNRKAEEQTDQIADVSTTNEHLILGKHSSGSHLRSRKGLSCLQIVLAIVLLLIAVICGIYVLCSTQPNVSFCVFTMNWLHHLLTSWLKM